MLTKPGSHIRELTERLLVLEARFRRLRWCVRSGTGLIVLTVVSLLFVGGSRAASDAAENQTAASKLLRTEALEIVDPDSRAKIRLSAKYREAAIVFDDERGKKRISLDLKREAGSAPDVSPALTLFDSKGNIGVRCAISDSPYIILRDKRDRNRIRLTLEYQMPQIEVLDDGGEKAVWRTP